MSSYQEALARWLYPVPNLAKLLLWKPAVFGPRPEDLVPFLDSTKKYCGEDSYEYAQELMEFGDACMAECSRDQALESYEKALSIYRGHGEDTYLTARAYDAIANVRRALNDYPGAEAALSKAVEIWNHLGEQPVGDVTLPERFVNQMARRREELEGISRVVKFNSLKPPKV